MLNFKHVTWLQDSVRLLAHNIRHLFKCFAGSKQECSAFCRIACLMCFISSSYWKNSLVNICLRSGKRKSVLASSDYGEIQLFKSYCMGWCSIIKDYFVPIYFQLQISSSQLFTSRQVWETRKQSRSLQTQLFLNYVEATVKNKHQVPKCEYMLGRAKCKCHNESQKNGVAACKHMVSPLWF